MAAELRALIARVGEGGLAAAAAREEVLACDDLYTMSAEEASRVLGMLGEVALSSGVEEKRITTTLIERGELVERLEDAQQLSPSTRGVKWRAKSEERGRQQRAQRRESEQLLAATAARLGNVALNRTAWAALRGARGATSPILELTEELLLAKPPVFWYGISLEELPEAELRGALGRLEMLFTTYGRGRFPEGLWRRYDEQLARLPAPRRPRDAGEDDAHQSTPTERRTTHTTRKVDALSPPPRWCCDWSLGWRRQKSVSVTK